MPKVLHLITSLTRGGIEMWLLTMLRQIPRDECSMDFACKGLSVGPLAPLAEQQGASVYHCQLGPDHLTFARKLQRILAEGEYDIVHNHLHVYSGFPVWWVQRLGIPVITSFHNTQFFTPEMKWGHLPLLRQMRTGYAVMSIDYALRHSDLVTGCSQGVIESLDPRGTKIPQGRARVLYYGVNIPQLASSEERANFRTSFGWDARTPIILHAGRFVEQKNHMGLLSIFQRVLEYIPNAELLLAGDGPLRSMVENAIEQHALSNTVRLLGSRDDVPSLMTMSDVFLFPSIHEGLPMVALEANAAGLPLVGSQIPGLVEAVQDGETALLHDVDDIEGMARSVIQLIDDPLFAKQLAVAGRHRIEENFSVEASANRLLQTYNELI